ncbi:ethanolamine ammonia-lyase subunit EutC [soil metagenome]
MKKTDMALVQADPWQRLRAHTSARIALGRVGASMPTDEVLRFGLAHAQARDAVHHPMASDDLRTRLSAAGFNALDTVRSQAPDRHAYLLRPDLGRRLDDACREALASSSDATGGHENELVIVIADGLSSVAVERHSVALLEAFRDVYEVDWAHVPVVIVEQGRVAVGDDIAEALKARIVVVLIGERPGLSSPDSLGIYFTWQPRVGKMDSERNCISNVRPEGLVYEAAAAKLAHMLRQASRLQLTGVALKDDSDAPALKSSSDTAQHGGGS